MKERAKTSKRVSGRGIDRELAQVREELVSAQIDSDLSGEVESLDRLAWLACARGRAEDALATARLARELAGEHYSTTGDCELVAVTGVTLVRMLNANGEPAEALRLVDKAELIARQLGKDKLVVRAGLERSESYRLLEEHTKAVESGERTLELLLNTDEPEITVELELLALLGQEEIALGRWEKALHYADAGAELARRSGYRQQLGWHLLRSGRVLLLTEQTEPGKERLSEAIEVFMESGCVEGVGDTLLSLGALCYKFGEHVTALAHWRLCGDLSSPGSKTAHSAAHGISLITGLGFEKYWAESEAEYQRLRGEYGRVGG